MLRVIGLCVASLLLNVVGDGQVFQTDEVVLHLIPAGCARCERDWCWEADNAHATFRNRAHIGSQVTFGDVLDDTFDCARVNNSWEAVILPDPNTATYDADGNCATHCGAVHAVERRVALTTSAPDAPRTHAKERERECLRPNVHLAEIEGRLLQRRAASSQLLEQESTTTGACFFDAAIGNGSVEVSGHWAFVENVQERMAPYNHLSCPFALSKYDCTALAFLRQQQMQPTPDARARIAEKVTFEATSCTLEHSDPSALLRKLAGLRIVFYGDSISKQHFISFVCHLWTAARRNAPTSWNPYARLPWLGRPHSKCAGSSSRGHPPGCGNVASGPHSDFFRGCVDFPVAETTTSVCYFQRFGESLIEEPPDIIIWNERSLHSPSPHKFRAEITKVLERLAEITRDRSSPLLTLYRESAPQHFPERFPNNDSGLGSGDHKMYENDGGLLQKTCCADSVAVDIEVGSWRRAVELELILAAGLPMLRLYSASASYLSGRLSHPGLPDCSHWCMPGVPDHWTRLLFNALMHSDSAHAFFRDIEVKGTRA